MYPGFSAHRADTEALNAARREALLSCYRYMRSLLERILTALTSRTLIIRNCFPDDNTLRMRAFLKNQTRLSHLSEVSFPNEMEMRRGESPHRSTALMNNRKPIVYFQKRRKGKMKNKMKRKIGRKVTSKLLIPQQQNRPQEMESSFYCKHLASGHKTSTIRIVYQITLIVIKTATQKHIYLIYIYFLSDGEFTSELRFS